MLHDLLTPTPSFFLSRVLIYTSEMFKTCITLFAKYNVILITVFFIWCDSSFVIHDTELTTDVT